MNGWNNILVKTLTSQIKTLFAFDISSYLNDAIVESSIRKAIDCKRRFCLNDDSKEVENGLCEIRPFHSIEYLCFLYWISRELYKNGNDKVASYIYYLNKTLNGCELFYEVELPNIWWCEYPLGTVIGKAKFGDYFFFYQGCTVGGNFRRDGAIEYPVLGEHVKMLSNSKVLGSSHIGDNVIISANTYIKDQNVPSNAIVFGASPNLVIKPNYFNDINCVKRNVLSI